MRQEGTDESCDEDEEIENGTEVEYDDIGKRIVPPSNKRYIYTVFD